MAFCLRRSSEKSPRTSRNLKRPEGVPETIHIPHGGFVSIQGEGFYKVDGPAEFLSENGTGPYRDYSYTVSAHLKGEPYRVYLRIPARYLDMAVEGRYDWGRHISDAEWLGGDRPYTLADLNRRPSRNATPFTGHPERRLAADLAEFYTLVEPYGFRDIYGFDFHSLTDDMIRHLRTREDVMAARGWLESVPVPDTGADAWRHGLISDLDGYMATISSNRRPSRRVFRRHRYVR